jgi:hypothetical protein
MHRHGSGGVLLLGLGVSLGLHAALAAGLVSLAHVGAATLPAADSGSANILLVEPEPQEPPQIRLGIERGSPDAAAWLGFEEPTEHLAPLAQVEQSAMALEEARLAGPQPDHPPLMFERAPAAPNIQPLVVAATEGAGLVEQAQAEAAVDSGSQGASGGASPADPGIVTDRESMASAIRRAPAVRPGRVLAIEGMEILTRRPRWTDATRATRYPSSPTVEIIFGADGRVRRADFARDGALVYSTGYEDVDEPLLTAVYNWTARGRDIDELPPGGEVRILITVLLR